MERSELAAWLRLALTPGVGNSAARRLLAAFGLPANVFVQSDAALRQVVPAAQASALRSEPAPLAALVEVTLRWLEQAGGGTRSILTLADPRYPAPLLNIEDPPLMLYVIGEAPQAWPRAIAVVGSRNPTPQGLVNARKFSECFAQAGLTVVSGLALHFVNDLPGTLLQVRRALKPDGLFLLVLRKIWYSLLLVGTGTSVRCRRAATA